MAQKYSKMGYDVQTESEVYPGLRADLVATKDGTMIIVELKSGQLTGEQKNRLLAIKDYVEKHNENVKLKLVLLNPPELKKIEYENLEEILFGDISDRTHSDLDILSTHTRIEGISDLEIDSIEINEDNTYIKGNGMVEVSLQNGSDKESREDDLLMDIFPFSFYVAINKNERIEEAEYNFDTSSYYE